MIPVHCMCGEVYQADDDKVGYSIICTRCQRLLDVKDASRKPIDVYKTKHQKNLPKLDVVVLLSILATVIGYEAYNMRHNSAQQAHAKISPQNGASASQIPQPPSPSSTKYAIQPPLGITSKPAQQYIAMPAPVLHNAASLPSGTDITPPIDTSGRSSLTVINGNGEDAVVKLVGTSDELSPQIAYRYVYVRARERCTISNIHAGQYSLLYKTGIDWNSQNSFNQGEQHHRFGKILDFEETVTEGNSGGERREWSVFTVTLNRVLLGNIRSQTISKEDFDQVK